MLKENLMPATPTECSKGEPSWVMLPFAITILRSPLRRLHRAKKRIFPVFGVSFE